jgi:HK97 family phage portal protein
LKLSIKNRLKVLASGSIDEYIKGFLSGEDLPGQQTVDTEMAMKYSAVSACVRVRAETFASVPMLLYKKTDDGRKQVTDLPIADILHGCPNSEMSPFGFKETLMTNFDISGNTVCHRLVGGTGTLLGLYPYNHSAVKIERDKETKKLIYVIGSGSEQKKLQRNEVLHVPNLSFDGVCGLSPISYAAQSILLGVSYEKYGVNFYRNAALPSGVFESPSPLSEPAYDRLKKGIKENYTGLKNSGIPMLLEEGMKWQQVTINPIDAQLLESKYFQIEDIARIYRVPQHLIGLLEHATFTNIEHQSLEFVMYTMLPIFKRFEDSINCQILTSDQRKNGYYVEAKIDGLLRGDSKTRADSYAMGRQWGWLSANDICRLENLPNIGTQGDIYLTPLNMGDSAHINDKSAANNYANLVEDIYKMISERR